MLLDVNIEGNDPFSPIFCLRTRNERKKEDRCEEFFFKKNQSEKRKKCTVYFGDTNLLKKRKFLVFEFSSTKVKNFYILLFVNLS